MFPFSFFFSLFPRHYSLLFVFILMSPSPFASSSSSRSPSSSISLSSLESSFAPYVQRIQRALKEHLQKVVFQKGTLGESMYYTACGTLGKGLRPLLSLMTAEALEVEQKEVLPFAVSLELIHTYSLIHDDLPSMDDDVERRGQKCNHLVFGEGMALLAGNALLVEALSLLVRSYSGEMLRQLLSITLESIGVKGMILGQAMDLSYSKEEVPLHASSISSKDSSKKVSSPSKKEEGEEDPLSSFQKMVFLKTGALFQVACVGSAFLAQANSDIVAGLKAYTHCLGMAFQVADDLLDSGKDGQKPSFYAFSWSRIHRKGIERLELRGHGSS